MTRELSARLVTAFLVTEFFTAGCESSSLDSQDGGAKATGGSAGINYTACESCAKQKCPSQASTCDSTTGCIDVLRCTLGCASSSTANCASNCFLNVSTTAQVAAASYVACATVASTCQSQCVPSVSTGSGGSGSQGGSGNVATGGGGGLHSGQNWLSITDSWADPGMPPNDLLKVGGAMYAYGDGCAQFTYSTSGCVSGTLCPPNAAGTNWGIGIGFDFHNTGSLGTPPNTKMPWNANAVGAVGLGWYLTGHAPGLQTWVTNLDPKWAGQCSAADCGIAGPPDGRSAPYMTDTAYFSSMEKDYWGGTGVQYTFNPANILAIQFKLNATKADLIGDYSFDFCVQGISVILP